MQKSTHHTLPLAPAPRLLRPTLAQIHAMSSDQRAERVAEILARAVALRLCQLRDQGTRGSISLP